MKERYQLKGKGDHVKYKIIRNKVVSEMRNNKSDYFRSAINHVNGNTTKLWENKKSKLIYAYPKGIDYI